MRYILKVRPDWRIVVLDDFSFGRIENLKEVEDQISVVKGDIGVIGDVERATRGVDIIVNFAAQTHVDRSIADPRPFVVTEVLGTNNLLTSGRKENLELYLQVSTDEVYGETLHGSFKPTDPVSPRNPYSAAKCGADMLVAAYWHTFGMPVLITRCTNNYGPFQHVEKFIPKAITSVLLGKRIPIYGDGQQIRDWIDVTDHCAGIYTVLEKGQAGKVYHIASGHEMKNIDVAKSILLELGENEAMLEHIPDRPGHDRRYSLDTSETRKLGWQPRVTFAKGIKETVAWYRQNQSWWKSLV